MCEVRLKGGGLLPCRRFSSWGDGKGNSLGANWILLESPRSDADLSKTSHRLAVGMEEVDKRNEEE